MNRALFQRLAELRTLIQRIAGEPAGPLELARLRALICQLLLDAVLLLDTDALLPPDTAVTAAIAYMRG